MNKHIYSVGQVNAYIKNMFAQDFMLHRISVKGEVSNCKYHSSGHIYFSLKDKTGTMAAVMFAGSRKSGLAFRMKDGDHVVVDGSVEVYERDGRYQLYAREIALEGVGALFLRFEALKKELAEMGMFAAEYKKPIPRYIRTLGVVTAPTGAAVQDIKNIAARRNPFVRVILYPAQVQGEGAVESIVNGIHALEQLQVDVIIVGRGGGSIEDLWAFNEEEVARAIFSCNIPVISAVGHETDTTIADFVADLRAPTPSAAAELAVYDYSQFRETMIMLYSALNLRIRERIRMSRQYQEQLQARLSYLNPQVQLNNKKQYLADLGEELEQAMLYRFETYRHRMQMLAQMLEGGSPVKKMSGGYSFVRDKTGHAVCSALQVSKGDVVSIQMLDGRLHAEIIDIEQGEETLK